MARTHRSTGRKRKAAKTGHRRDYRAEYARRIQLGISRGLSHSQARGHARAGERPKPSRPVIVNSKSKEELAIKVMARGLTLRDAARDFGLSEQHLRRYVKENANAVWDRRQRLWIIDDQRARQFPVYSEGELKTLTLKPYAASEAGSFMHAAGRFFWTGDRQLLVPYEGEASPMSMAGFTSSKQTRTGFTSSTARARSISQNSIVLSTEGNL
jgi:hypothetical protein